MVSPVRSAAFDAVLEVKGARVSDDDEAKRLDEFDIDSLDLIEIGMLIEERFEVQLDSNRFDGVQTVGDLLGVLEEQIAEQQGPA